MGAYPTSHIPTREKVLKDIKQWLTRELGEVERAIALVHESGGTAIELSVERNTLARVLKFVGFLG